MKPALHREDDSPRVLLRPAPKQADNIRIRHSPAPLYPEVPSLYPEVPSFGDRASGAIAKGGRGAPTMT